MKITINRAPVLTLWAAVVAERMGYGRTTALTLGQALAALNAQSKGRRLGVYEKTAEPQGPQVKKKRPSGSAGTVSLLGREIPVVKTSSGLRAALGGEESKPESVQQYLEKKFGEHLAPARQAMSSLARTRTRAQLETEAFDLYEKFRPRVPDGKKGWGAKGQLDLDVIRRLHKK